MVHSATGLSAVFLQFRVFDIVGQRLFCHVQSWKGFLVVVQVGGDIIVFCR